MAKTMARVESDLAIHPGELLAEELEVRGMTQRHLAEAMGRPVQAINEIVRGKKAITAETAVQLEAALQIPAHLWLNMQTDYDLILARRAVREPRTVPRPKPARAPRP
jgi:HTH-type transcriptional regulator/antitoxin HigA